MNKAFSLTALFFLCAFYFGFGQILTFEFNGLVGNEPSASSNYNDANLNTSSITRGSGLTASNNGNRFNATSWALTNINNAISGDDYMEFSINPQSGFKFSITNIVFNVERSSTGLRGIALRSSIDSYSSNIDGEKAIADNTNLQVVTFSVNLSDITTNTTFRIYGWSEATGGSGGFEGSGNDIIVNGSVSVISTNTPDFCNIQFPENGTIQLGEAFTVYAQVFEAGITENLGNENLFTAEIGYSTNNTDPSTWTDWITVTNPTDQGNNYEYSLDLGNTIPSEGTYYYASRFSYNNGPYAYGGYSNDNGGQIGGFWGDANGPEINRNGILTVNQNSLQFCNVQFPGSGTITTGDTFEVYAQVYEANVTDTPNSQGNFIDSWIGYSTTDNDPSSSAGWTWVQANYNPNCGTDCGTPENNDEYSIDIGSGLSAGTYYYASRFKIGNSNFYYGGYSAGGGGLWSSGVNNNGVLVVQDPIGSSCLEDGFDSIDGWSTYSAGNWTENADSGTYIGNDVYVSTGDAIADNKVGFNDTNDWLELPTVDNPVTLTYWGRLSSAPTGLNKMKVQVFDSGIWNDVVEHTLVSENYSQYSANLSAYSSLTNVRIRLLMSAYNRSIYIDDLEVICSSCTPTHSITNVSPNSGPANTEVIIQGTGFTASSSVSFNGTNATINSWTSNSLTVTVPTSATTGNIIVSESGCDVISNLSFTVIKEDDSSCQGGVSASELFISEITDATSGSLTYIEIYNGTGSAIADLSDYSIEITYNVNGGSLSEVLSGSLANGDVHVINTVLNTTCSVPGGDGSYSDQTSTLNGIDTAKNDADCIKLLKNGSIIDVWGDCTDKNWRENNSVPIGSEGFNFKRLSTSTPLPNTAFDLSQWSIIDWIDGSGTSTCNENDYSHIGIYASGLPPIVNSISASYTTCEDVALTVSASEGFSGGNGLVYQWYYFDPSDVTPPEWKPISDDATFSNSTTNVLTITNANALSDYQFYCEVREDDATCYSASDAIKFDIADVTWNDEWIWSDGVTANGTVPTAANVVTMIKPYDTSIDGGSFSACSLIVSNGTLNITDGYYVEVINDVDIITNGNLTVQPKGSLVQRGEGINAGTFSVYNLTKATVNKKTAKLQNWYDYTYWSSPISNLDVGSGLFLSNPSRRYWFNASNFIDQDVDGVDDVADSWTLLDDTDIMEPGMGIAATHDPLFFTPNTAYTYSFQGQFNTGDITYPVVYNTLNDLSLHWNLLGNPYPSALDADLFFAENGAVIYEAIYMWSHVRQPDGANPGNEVLNFNQNDYVTINFVGEADNGADTNDDGVIDALDTPERKVPSGQGFFIPSRVGGNVTFTNAMRVSGDNENIQFFRTTPNTEAPHLDREALWLNLSSNIGIYSQICVAYAEIATNGYDGNAIDTKRNYAGNAGMIYSMMEGDPYSNYVIQGKALSSLNEDEIVPIGFGAYISSSAVYTLDVIKTEGGFLNNNPIYIKDSYLNAIHDLSESSYQFTSEGGTFNDRFSIVFKNENTLSEDKLALKENGLSIVELQNGNVQFALKNSSLTISKVSIIDLQGRLVYTLSGGSSREVYDLNNLSTAAYIAKVELSNGIVITKKAIKKL